MDFVELPNLDLLDRMPLGARVVLDVGCASGALGAEYLRRNPAARVLGIDRDGRAAAMASRRYDRVFTTDLDTDPLPFAGLIGHRSIDLLIYGDVLQCLRDPAAVLAAHLPYLTEDGVALLCVPNLEHWSFASALLRGTWDYESSGLFDTAHLRWFSRETVERMLRKVGLVPGQPTRRIFDARAAAEFAEKARPTLLRLGVDPDSFARRSAPLQYVWCATQQPQERLPVVSTMLPPTGGVSHLRVTEPMAALAAEPSIDARVVESGTPLPGPEETPGIYIMHRPALIGDDGLSLIRALVDRGWLMVCEFDDNPEYMRALQTGVVHNFRAVHAVQTSTPVLGELLRRDNPEVAVFPNAVARLPTVANFRDPERLTMLFAGINRENEWQPFIGALNSVAQKVGERLRVIVVGDRGIHEQLRTPYKRLLPLCSYDIYQSLLSSCEISFMPLQDTPFNRCKSDLKFIEAAASRAVALATPVVYGHSIEDGRTGILFRDAQELEQRLLRLVVDPELARGIGDAAREHVIQQRMLASQMAARVRWYHALWSRREELTTALRARVPELAT